MSRIFDVIKKTDLIDPRDMADMELDSNEPGVAGSRPAPDLPAPARAPVSTRSLPLRVSAHDPIFPFDQSQHAAAEQYRIIRTKILHHVMRPKLVVVSGTRAGDGKTITSINIAASLALKEGTSVLLVDADMRRPRIADLLGIPQEPGLAEVLSGQAGFDQALVRAEQFPNLSILPAGHVAGANPAELLDSTEWKALVERIRARFNYCVLDTTPVATVADYELMQLVCDGVILVVRPDHTERKQFLKVLDVVAKEKLLGVVLNHVEKWWLWKDSTYGYYGQEPSAVVRKVRRS
jgi:capsular exopolysaccharide synthesis family protein